LPFGLYCYICPVSFLYPLFLLAGLTLLLPVLIHLFNLRRYKTLYFPNTAFLKNIQLSSRKQSQLRYKWLLLTRLLFLASLILAFAQPFFKTENKENNKRLKIIYIDNSASMSLKKANLSLLDRAKAAARQQVLHAPAGARFVLLSNNRHNNLQALPADKLLSELDALDICSEGKTVEQIMATVQQISENEQAPDADLFYYSDMQQHYFAEKPKEKWFARLHFYGIAVQSPDVSNIYIDTAYLNVPALQNGSNNILLVKTVCKGDAPKESPVLQLRCGTQVKSAATLNFTNKKERIDTLSFAVNDDNWQQLELSINAGGIRQDDTFRISAKSAGGLTVLELDENKPNPFIQAAFKAVTNFKLNTAPLSNLQTPAADKDLIILNGISKLDAAQGKQIAEALERGQSVAIFPAKNANPAAFNEGLATIGELSFSALDTAAQTVSTVQEGSSLVKDIFEHIPTNVQLPLVQWHYIIQSGLSANRQSVLSFRNGDPFLAKYGIGRGQLYLCAASADLQAGNFPGSYFFAPFLYQMALQSKSAYVFALSLGKQQAIYLSLKHTGERNMVHLYKMGTDVIPPQRSTSAGLEIFPEAAVQQAGFYMLAAPGSDSTCIALNADNTEAASDVWDPAILKKQWKGTNIYWTDIEHVVAGKTGEQGNSFPLWKVCVILALLMLAAETYLLASRIKKPTIA